MYSRFLFVFLFTCAVSACGESGLSVEVDVDAENEAKIVGDKLVEAVNRLDVLGDKAWRDLTDSQRSKIEDLNKKLSSLIGGVALNVHERHLWLRITQYSGSLEVNSWLNDDESNWIWRGKRLIDKSVTLPVSHDKVWVDSALEFVPQKDREALSAAWAPFESAEKHDYALRQIKTMICEGSASKRQSNLFRIVRSQYKDSIDNAFQEHLNSGSVIPTPEQPRIDVRRSLGRAGTHTLNVEVVPLELNSSNHWSVQGQVVSADTEGNEEIVKEFSLSTEDIESLGSPIDPIQILLYVQKENAISES